VRLAIIGVSHWHAPLFYRPAAGLPGVEIVAVSDDDATVVARAAGELGARLFLDYRELLEFAQPDFVFAFGRHCDLPAIGQALIDQRIPFVIEKPAGLNAADVKGLAEQARAVGLHAGTGFNYRGSELLERLLELTADDPATHASFRYISGPPQRYHQLGCSWMLDPALSGGGSTINLASHFVDLFRLLTQSPPSEVSALMGNHAWRLPIEDYSAVTMRSGQATGVVETGYSFPGELGRFDYRFSLRTSRHYVIAHDDDRLEIIRADDQRSTVVEIPTSNFRWYPNFVARTLERFAEGLPPLAPLDDLVVAMQVIDAAYRSDRAGGISIGSLPPAETETPGRGAR
jgi:predicted dehydrogenase